MSVSTVSLSPSVVRTRLLHRRVRMLVAATISYNAVEAVVAITAGTLASSGALVAFGLDSIVEVLSAAAVAWQFSSRDPSSREHVALRLIAASFFALAAYVTFESARTLVHGVESQHSTVGIALAAASVLIMPGLSHLQRRAGRELGSASVVADSKQTLLCSYLSGVLLGGLMLNSLFGWSWADPLAALLIAAVAVREGVEALRGKACCAPPAALLTDSAAVSDDRSSGAACDCCNTEPASAC